MKRYRKPPIRKGVETNVNTRTPVGPEPERDTGVKLVPSNKQVCHEVNYTLRVPAP